MDLLGGTKNKNRMKEKFSIISILFVFCSAIAAGKDFNVKHFGAKGNGKTMDSPAIQKAIDRCSESGGGKVIVPAGTYLCATIIAHPAKARQQGRAAKSKTAGSA